MVLSYSNRVDQTILARGYIWLNFEIVISSSANIISGVSPFSTIYRLNVVVKCSLRKKFRNCSSGELRNFAPKHKYGRHVKTLC